MELESALDQRDQNAIFFFIYQNINYLLEKYNRLFIKDD